MCLFCNVYQVHQGPFHLTRYCSGRLVTVLFRSWPRPPDTGAGCHAIVLWKCTRAWSGVCQASDWREGGFCVCVRGMVVGAVVDVTPTLLNAPDPEQMARHGPSAEPELIACAMSHCLRRPCWQPTPSYPDFSTPPSLPVCLLLTFLILISIFIFFNLSPLLLAFLSTSSTSNHLCLHHSPPPAFWATLQSAMPTLAGTCLLIHSPIHSFILRFSRHSFTGLPTSRGFIRGQLRHLRF